MRTLLTCGLLAVLVAAPARATSSGGPLHLVRWSGESVRLQPGETATLQVAFDQMPLRRWTLLVESSGERVCHLNVVRDRDGSLIYDVRDESRHEVSIPWGTGESLTAIVTAGRRGGVFDLSLWGPPAGETLRAYSYEVNRALEALEAGRRDAAVNHARAALIDAPDDSVAAILLEALVRPEADLAGESRVDRLREQAAAQRAAGRLYEALATLDAALAAAAEPAAIARVFLDLGELYVELENPVQAREALTAARAVGLPDDLDARAARALAALPDSLPR